MRNNIQKNNFKNKSLKQRLGFIFADSNLSIIKIIFAVILIVGFAGLIFAGSFYNEKTNNVKIVQQASAQMTASFTEDFSGSLYIDSANTTAFLNTVGTQISLTGDNTVVETEPMDVDELVGAVPLTGGGYAVFYGYSSNQQYFQIYDSDGNKSGSQVEWWPFGVSAGYIAVGGPAGDGFATIHTESDDHYLQQYDSYGALVGSKTKINTSSINPTYDTDIIGHSNGDYSIFWVDATPPNVIYTRRYDSSSASPVTGEIIVNTYPSVVEADATLWTIPLNDGGYIVLWNSNEVDHEGLFAQRFDSSDNKICFNTTAPCPDDLDDSNGREPEYLITDNRDNEVGLIQLSNGNIAISKSDSGNILYYMYESDGTVITIPNDNWVGLVSQGSFQDMAELTGGGFVIVRKHSNDIRFNVLDDQGTAINQIPILANTDTEGEQQNASIVALNNGGFVIMWRTAGAPNVYYFQVFDSDGNKIGEEQPVDAIDNASSASIYDINSFIIPYKKPWNDEDIFLKHYSDTLVPAQFELGPQTVRSARINPYHNDISAATFTANDTPNGQTIDYYLSNDGGATWEPFAGNPHTFVDPSGDDLRWRADLTSASASLSPIINSITINYTYGADRDPATYTVCPAGPPTCDYAVLQDAVDAVPGTLDNNYVIDIYTGTYENIDLSGKTGNPVYSLTIQSHPGENAHIRCNSCWSSTIKGNENTHYVTLDNLEVTNMSHGAFGYDCVNISDGSYNTIMNSNIHDCWHDYAITMGSYATIDNNDVYDMFEGSGIWGVDHSTISNNIIYNATESGSRGIIMGDYTLAENNTIYDMGYGIETGLLSEIYQNKIYSCGQYGIENILGLRNIMKNNIIYDNEYGGVFIGLFGGYGNEFDNNVVYDNRCFGVAIFNTFLYPGSPGSFKNNIIANNNNVDCSGGLGLNWGGFTFGPIGTISYNLFYNNGLDGNGHYGGAPLSSPEIEAYSNIDHFYIAESLFTDIDGGDNIYAGAGGCDDDFTLQAGSPGINLGDPTSDYSNEPAPNGSRIDMGAYGGINAEYIGSGICGVSGSATPSNNTAPSLNSLSASGSQEITIIFNAIDAESDTCNVTPTLGSGILYSIDNTSWHEATILDSTDINLTSSPIGVSNSVLWDAPADLSGYSGDIYIKVRISDGSLFSEWEDYSFNTSTVGTGLAGKIFFRNGICDEYISTIDLGDDLCIYQIDNSLDENPGATETINVTVTSGAGDSETFSLTETGVDTGIFKKDSIETEKASASTGDIKIQASRSDTITAEYEYASPISTTDIEDFESYASTNDMLLTGGGPWGEVSISPGYCTVRTALGIYSGHIEGYAAAGSSVFGLAFGKQAPLLDNGIDPADFSNYDLDGKMLKFKIFIEDPANKFTSINLGGPVLSDFIIILADEAGNQSYMELDATNFPISTGKDWGGTFTWADWDNDWDELEVAVNNTNFTAIPPALGPGPADLTDINQMFFVAITGDLVTCNEIHMKTDDVNFGTPLTGYTDIDNLNGYIDTATMQANGNWAIAEGTSVDFYSTSTKTGYSSAIGQSADGTTIFNSVGAGLSYWHPGPGTLDLDNKILNASVYIDNPEALNSTGFDPYSIPLHPAPYGENIHDFVIILADSIDPYEDFSIHTLTASDFTVSPGWNNFSIPINSANFQPFPSTGPGADLSDIQYIMLVAVTGERIGPANDITIAVDNISFETPSSTTKTITKTLDNKFNRMLLELYTVRPPTSLSGDYVQPIFNVSTFNPQTFISNIYTKVGADDATGDYSGDDANTEFMDGTIIGALGAYAGWHHYFTIYEDLANLTGITANIQGFSDDGGEPLYFYAWNDNTLSWVKEDSHSSTSEDTLTIDITPPGDDVTDYIDVNKQMHFSAIVDDADYSTGFYEDYMELIMTFSQYTYSANVNAAGAGGSVCIDAVPISPLNVTADAYPLTDGTYVIRLTWDAFTGTYLYVHRDHLDSALNYYDTDTIQANPLATLSYTDNQYIDSTGIYPGTTYTYNLRSANSCGQIDQPGTEFDITVEEQDIGEPEIIIRMGVRIVR